MKAAALEMKRFTAAANSPFAWCCHSSVACVVWGTMPSQQQQQQQAAVDAAAAPRLGD
jgi:hypothetical protein